MDRLNNNERIEAWKSAWQRSLTGKAIVDRTGKFVSVNPQWVKMLGVSAAEFYGSTFQEITPKDQVQRDQEQADLVANGSIDSYEMDKSYVFSNGTAKKVRLLVTRVPLNTENNFMYYLAEILLRVENIPLPSNMSRQPESGKRNEFESFIRFISKYWIWIATASAVIAGLLNEIFQMGFFQNGL